jgi:hypothetical protein
MIRGVLLALGILAAQSGCSGSSKKGSEVADGGGGSGGGARAGAPAAGGSGASGGGAGGTSDDPCTCVPYEIAWWYDGGRMALERKYRIKQCNTFVYSEGPPARQCESQVAQGCDEALGVAAISAALDSPEIEAAMAAAPILYGSDPRPVDGQLLHVELNGKIIEIGEQCSGDGLNCDIPNSIESLPFTLNAVQQHELRTDCLLPEAP